MRVRTSIAMAAGSALTLIITQPWQEPATTTVTETFVRTEIEEVLTTIDLEELRDQVDDLNVQLNDECVAIIQRLTGDQEAGIRNLIERHYDGDACRLAAEEQRARY